MKVLVVGANGQAGRTVLARAPAWARAVSADRCSMDITDRRAVLDVVRDVAPAVIVNAAAYTNVEAAESDAATAFAVNADGPGHLAEAARAVGGRLIHISTDYVFSGASARPLRRDDPTGPLNAYGHSKLAGERRVRETLDDDAVILRTSWLYSRWGVNFVLKMLDLMRSQPEIRVVADQIGSPTWAGSLADVVWRAIDCGAGGTYHWSDAGQTSWHGFAAEILAAGREIGLLQDDVDLIPVRSLDFPTKARRPAFSVLDLSRTESDLGVTAVRWQNNLRKMLVELKELQHA